MNKIKGMVKSMVVWFNSIILACIPLLDALKDYLPGLQAYMTVENFKVIGIIVIVVNILLRFRTTKPLEEK